MIDVHVLTYSGTVQPWLDQCLESLSREPNLTVHVVQGDEGNVGAGRARGYRLGTNPYVSYVDSDDYILPGAIDACLFGLKTARGVVTLERRLWGTRFDSSLQRDHHLCVYRRDDVEPWLDRLHEHPIHCDILLTEKLRPTQLGFIGYVWRMHAGQAHRSATKEQRARLDQA